MGIISCNTSCSDQYGCPDNQSPNFIIRRHDTKPPFEIVVEDCDGPLDLTDTVVEVSMWSRAKLKTALAVDDIYFALADNVGFNQILVDDIIVIDRIRNPEQMLVTGFDETNKFVRVQRSYNGTLATSYKKGQSMRMFRILNGVGETQMTYQDIQQIDGTIQRDVLIESKLIYEWRPEDTCVPGCYWFEFKLLKMTTVVSATANIIPSFTSFTPEESGCGMGAGVEWVRRLPVEGEGFLISITDSPTFEGLL